MGRGGREMLGLDSGDGSRRSFRSLQVRAAHKDELLLETARPRLWQSAIKQAANGPEKRSKERQIDYRKIGELGVGGAGEHRGSRDFNAFGKVLEQARGVDLSSNPIKGASSARKLFLRAWLSI